MNFYFGPGLFPTRVPLLPHPDPCKLWAPGNQLHRTYDTQPLPTMLSLTPTYPCKASNWFDHSLALKMFHYVVHMLV
ncbi:hypothetical protein XELAEV_18042050mg [Xenopus laevis]|uniref:Uncharacterized protein n=1 Tax=Xenopus laevis TaxID=8355 RepID=A0A974C3H0_XENLA|nr:hypothetical protein XELAEV_18042050mg [Xenopus laevis]